LIIKKKIDLKFEVRNENKNIATMSSIQDYINSKKNMVCSECKETNFHINMVIRYEGGEPFISYGDALSVWCGNCDSECDLIERPKEEEEETICEDCEVKNAEIFSYYMNRCNDCCIERDRRNREYDKEKELEKTE